MDKNENDGEGEGFKARGQALKPLGVVLCSELGCGGLDWIELGMGHVHSCEESVVVCAKAVEPAGSFVSVLAGEQQFRDKAPSSSNRLWAGCPIGCEGPPCWAGLGLKAINIHSHIRACWLGRLSALHTALHILDAAVLYFFFALFRFYSSLPGLYGRPVQYVKTKRPRERNRRRETARQHALSNTTRS
jgi:hypothetical protein